MNEANCMQVSNAKKHATVSKTHDNHTIQLICAGLFLMNGLEWFNSNPFYWIHYFENTSKLYKCPPDTRNLMI